MAYNSALNSGFADRKSWMEVDNAIIASDILPAEEATNLDRYNVDTAEDRRYAQLVYVVNPAGTTVVTIPDTVMTEENTYSSVIEETTSGDTYVAEAAPGTARGSALWRVKQIITTPGGSFNTTTIKWAGTGAFDQVATAPLSGLVYS